MASEAHFVDATLTDAAWLDGTCAPASPEAVAAELRDHRVLAFVGMAFEANIAAGPGVLVFCRNARRELAAAAATAARRGCRGIISFGVAGGLDPTLRAGDCIVASAVLDGRSIHVTDKAWSSRLLETVRSARHATVMGVDAPVADPRMKRELRQATGAAAVDMESHVVAELAAAHGLAFAALRVIVDPAHRTIPGAALLGMGGRGRADVAAVLRDLVVRPMQVGPLARIAFEAFSARTELIRIRDLLGPHFGLAASVPPVVAMAQETADIVLQRGPV
jgi:hopanoid-associated phosphorylase